MAVFTASRSRGGEGSSRPFCGLLTPKNHRIITLYVLSEIFYIHKTVFPV